jgi:TPR repeat protein
LARAAWSEKIPFMKSLFSFCAVCLFAISHALAATEAVQGSAREPEEVFQEARQHLLGKEVPRDPEKALKLMKEAAESGHAEALGGVGYFYATGFGVSKDPEEAARWFRKGAETGSAKAQFNLGSVLLGGEGVPKDEAGGREWIKRAAEAGFPEAQARLGQMYFFGESGIGSDYEEARKWLFPAAEAGVPQAQNTLGFIYAHAKGVPADPAAAEQWFRKAAEQGDAKAQSNLGGLLTSPAITDPARRTEGYKWLLVAEAANEITAVKKLEELRPGADPKQMAEARKAADDLKRKLFFRSAKRQQARE